MSKLPYLLVDDLNVALLLLVGVEDVEEVLVDLGVVLEPLLDLVDVVDKQT